MQNCDRPRETLDRRPVTHSAPRKPVTILNMAGGLAINPELVAQKTVKWDDADTEHKV